MNKLIKILILVIATLLFSCSTEKSNKRRETVREDKNVLHNYNPNFRIWSKNWDFNNSFVYEIDIIKIDSCEYIQTYDHIGGLRLIPKTDCKFCLKIKR